MPKNHSGLGSTVYEIIYVKLPPEMISYCKITVMFVLLYFFHWDLGAAQWQPNHKISRRLEALMVGMP